MRRRRLFLMLAGLAGLMALAWGVVAMLPPQPGVTKGNFDRIENGMTLAEVNQIFGRENMAIKGMTLPEDKGSEKSEMWIGDDSSVAVVRFTDDRVTNMVWSGSDETFLDKIRRSLHFP